MSQLLRHVLNLTNDVIIGKKNDVDLILLSVFLKIRGKSPRILKINPESILDEIALKLSPDHSGENRQKQRFYPVCSPPTESIFLRPLHDGLKNFVSFKTNPSTTPRLGMGG